MKTILKFVFGPGSLLLIVFVVAASYYSINKLDQYCLTFRDTATIPDRDCSRIYVLDLVQLQDLRDPLQDIYYTSLYGFFVWAIVVIIARLARRSVSTGSQLPQLSSTAGRSEPGLSNYAWRGFRDSALWIPVILLLWYLNTTPFSIIALLSFIPNFYAILDEYVFILLIGVFALLPALIFALRLRYFRREVLSPPAVIASYAGVVIATALLIFFGWLETVFLIGVRPH